MQITATKPNWSTRMEQATKPFRAKDREQTFSAFCNVLNEQNKLFCAEHTLTAEQADAAKQQFGDFKDMCRQMATQGEKVFECAKRYHLMCHCWLMEKTAEWGDTDYNLYLETLWLKNNLMEWEDKEGIKRLLHLLKHPGEGISPYQLFRLVEQQDAPRTETQIFVNNNPKSRLPEWKVNLYWELYNPSDTSVIAEETALCEELRVGEDFPAIEKYDSIYIKTTLKEKLRLLEKQRNGLLSDDETRQLAFIEKVLQDAFRGSRANINPKTARRRGRIFKKSEDNRSYACIAMSINRSITVFPAGSLERKIFSKNFRFVKGKFYWGTAAAGETVA